MIGPLFVLVACSEDATPPRVFATLELIDSIGCPDCPGPEQFGAVQAISMGPDGSLAILTREEPLLRIARVGAEGVRAFGTRGQGPGEISDALAVAVLADGAVMVAGSRFDYFSPEGLHLERRAHTAGSDQPGLTQFLDSSPSGRWMVTHDFQMNPALPMLLRVFDHEQRTTETPVRVPEAWMNQGRGQLIAHAISDEGVTAMGLGRSGYTLMLVDQDGDAVHGGRDIEKVPRSEEEIAALNRQMGLTIGESGVSMPDGAAPPSVSIEFPHFGVTSLRFDGAGRLWVLTPRGGEEGTVFDVFSDRLDYLGEVHAPGRIAPYDLAYETLAGVVRGALDVPIVKVWRIVEASDTDERPAG